MTTYRSIVGRADGEGTEGIGDGCDERGVAASGRFVLCRTGAFNRILVAMASHKTAPSRAQCPAQPGTEPERSHPAAGKREG